MGDLMQILGIIYVSNFFDAPYYVKLDFHTFREDQVYCELKGCAEEDYRTDGTCQQWKPS